MGDPSALYEAASTICDVLLFVAGCVLSLHLWQLRL